MLKSTQDNLTISQIIKFWQKHSVDDKDLADSIQESYLKILQKNQIKDSEFSIRDNQWYKDSDVSKFYVAINVQKDSLQIVSDIGKNPELIGFVIITKNQLEFIQSMMIDKQIPAIIQFVKDLQLLYSTSLNKIFLNINQIDKLSEEQANDVFIAHNLYYVSDNDLNEMWHTDFETFRDLLEGSYSDDIDEFYI